MKKLGKAFAEEVTASALFGLPFSWTDAGDVIGREALTPEQNALLDQIIGAHDPDKPPKSKRVLSRKQFFYGLELRPEGSVLSAYSAWVSAQKNETRIYFEAEDRFLEANKKMERCMTALGLDLAAFFDFAITL